MVQQAWNCNSEIDNTHLHKNHKYSHPSPKSLISLIGKTAHLTIGFGFLNVKMRMPVIIIQLRGSPPYKIKHLTLDNENVAV